MGRRMRAAPSLCLFGWRRLGSYHSRGRGRRRMPSVEHRRRCSYRSLERIRSGRPLGSRAVWDIRNGCRHCCSAVVCHALRIIKSTNGCTSTCHQCEENTVGHFGGGESGPSSTAGENHKYLPNTPTAPAPAPPSAPGDPAVTTVDSGSDDDNCLKNRQLLAHCRDKCSVATTVHQSI